VLYIEHQYVKRPEHTADHLPLSVSMSGMNGITPPPSRVYSVHRDKFTSTFIS
jgi:hypothetical protein